MIIDQVNIYSLTILPSLGLKYLFSHDETFLNNNLMLQYNTFAKKCIIVVA
jgi:hypothetical protein